MISYLTSIKDTESKLCSPEIFAHLTRSPSVAHYIAAYRKGNRDAKQQLPSFMFQGYDPNLLLGKRGSRLAKDLKPTGLVMVDFDHIEDPMKLFDTFRRAYTDDIKAGNVALIHITPSGKGLRVVMRTPNGRSIEEAQAEVEQKLGVKQDRVVKDLSRQSFCPRADDILYINKDLLFKTPDNTNDTTGTGNNQDNDTRTGNAQRLPKGTNLSSQAVGDSNLLRAADDFPTHFKGIAYTRIVDELINVLGGTPEVGNRENTLFRLASDMAKITDRSALWLEKLLPTFGLPEEEWRTTIAQVCRKPIDRGISRSLQTAISRCKTSSDNDGSDNDDDSLLSLDDYKDNFPTNAPSLVKLLTSRCMPHMKPALSQMCFPALAAHVHQHKFLMSDNSRQELGIMAVLVGKQSTGKSCIDQPISIIMADIVAVDKVNRKRQEEYNERQRNRKASERGEKRPDDIIIRCIGGNVTNAALLQLLTAAEEGDKHHPNQCLYSEVQEIQRLYKMGKDGTRYGVSELIKAAFDRSTLDSARATNAAVNAYTPARWNFSAVTTPVGAKDFFSGKLLTDGTLSRVAFVKLPEVDIPSNLFRLGNYDDDFKAQLEPYIQNLSNYKHPTDSEGNPIPLFVEQADRLRERINELIDIEKYVYPDQDTYTAYAYRTRDIVVRQALTTYIANGCQWENCEDYWMWVYSELIDTKLDMFGDLAAEKFRDEKPRHSGGRQKALKFMPRVFTFAQFAKFCEENGNIAKNPKNLIRRYKNANLITEEGGNYTVSDEICEKYGIK